MNAALRALRPRILDRYMLEELAGPFGFGVAAFTLLLAAGQLIAIGRVVSEANAPVPAAIEAFLWQLPGDIELTIPMGLLLGTLLAISRLSGESEITAMKAGGITLLRIIAPLLAAGLVLSLVTFALGEAVVPYAQTQVDIIENTVINHTSAFANDLNVNAPLPGGGRQTTVANAYDPHSRALLQVTLIQYDRGGKPIQIVFADRAIFTADRWTLDNARIYRFAGSGEVTISQTPALEVQLGESPAEIEKRAANNNPQSMSRAEIAQIIGSGQLTPGELRKYVMAFQQKLAQPFACFVFTLIAVPFGMRASRGGSTGLGFGLAILIVFIYYIAQTICSYIGEAYLPLAALAAWTPNLLFTAIGLRRVYGAAMV